MKTKLLILLTISCTLSAAAGPRASADYTLTPEAIGGAGGRAASTDYTIDHAIGTPGGAAASTDLTLRGGYAGQLFEVVGLALNADPATLDEGGSRQLAVQAVLDDDSLLALAPEEVAWSVVAGPLDGIDVAGLTTAGLVYQDTAATARGGWAGLTGDLALTVLDTIPDNFGLYAGDGLDDSWQALHFGLDNPLAAPGMDPDGDGQDNEFEHTAGLDPTDPLSRFLLRIESVPGQPAHRRLVFSPRFDDREYRLFTNTTLGPGGWDPFTSGLTSDDGTERTVTDPDATDPTKFYRVEITKP